MKKLLKWLMAAVLGLSLSACSSSSGPSSVEIANGVTFSMVDVLEVDNDNVNTVFFYFLAGIDNNSDQDFHMSNLDYQLTTDSKQEYQPINPIDQYRTIITNDVKPGMSTYIYGYIGVPKTENKTLGLYVKSKDAFIPFKSVDIRKIDDAKVINSDEKKFTIYEDEYFEFDVDATNLAYHYQDGVSTIDGLIINYTNKTDQRLVVPFLSPICTIDGFKLSSLPNGEELKGMSQEQISSMDFTNGDLQAKTEPLKAESLGYQMFYLGPNAAVPANISFRAEGIIPDFSAKQKNGITITINSPSLGYRQTMKVPY